MQGQCGSCWAFTIVGSVEGQHAIKTGQLVSLSAQQLMDCSDSYGNHGCEGGFIDNTYKYIKSIGGLDSEKCYRYKAEVSCSFNKDYNCP